MLNLKALLPSSIGFIMMAIIVSFASWDISNIWIPISAILIALGLIVFVIRSVLTSIEERLNKLEEQSDE